MSVERARLLLERRRPAEAEREARAVLSRDAEDVEALLLLGVCLSRNGRREEGLAAVRKAVGLRPDASEPRRLLGHLLLELGRLDDAEGAADAAVMLNPGGADGDALCALIALQRRDWANALAWADRGLAGDPQHPTCADVRGVALLQLGRADEAGETIAARLRDDPDDPDAHTGAGWRALDRRRPKEALEHFHAALRLEPDHGRARAGLVEALKARNPVYRWMLAFFMGMNKLPARTQVLVLLGGFGAYHAAGMLGRAVPALRPVTTPLLVGYLGFVLLTWVSGPLFDLTLLASRRGRAAVLPNQRRGALTFGAFLLLPLVVLAFGVAWGAWSRTAAVPYLTGQAAVPLLLLVLPVAGWTNAFGTPRARTFGLIVAGIFGLIVLWLSASAAGAAWAPAAESLMTYGFIAGLWAVILLGVKPARA